MDKRLALRRSFAFVMVACAVALVISAPARGGAATAGGRKARNVIVLLVDGCASEQYTLARWVKGQPLALDGIRVGAVKTYISDSVIADSAPAATAFATGRRTSDKFISVGPNERTISGVPRPTPQEQFKPLATVLEGARLKGKATGIVATSRVTHATPAAYVAHVPNRSMEEDIMEQAVYQNIDVVFGGGGGLLAGKDAGGKRSDRENLVIALEERGYQMVATRDQMMRLKSGKVFGMFAASHMEAEIDRPRTAPEQPTLEEMTRKAIELLAGDRDGFFLLVEASQVDWACHANDPAHMISDLIMYDRAVQVALDFARKTPNTLLLAFSDHNTGGFSIGNTASSKSYSQMTPETLIDPLKKMKLSAPALWKKVGEEKTPERVQNVVGEFWGVEISAEEAREILAVAESDPENPQNCFGEVICPKHTAFGWTTHGHCGGDVPLHAFGPGRPTGVIDGPDIGQVTARAMRLDLNKLNRRLFAEASSAFHRSKVTVDRTDPENLVVRVAFQGRTARLPVNKNLLEMNGTVTRLEGVVVYVPNTDKVYLPLQAVYLIKGIPPGKLPIIGK